MELPAMTNPRHHFPAPKFTLKYAELEPFGLNYVEYMLGAVKYSVGTTYNAEDDEDQTLGDFERVNVAILICPELLDLVKRAHAYIAGPDAITFNDDGTSTQTHTQNDDEHNKLRADLMRVIQQARV
jgi:hypothetical protein